MKRSALILCLFVLCAAGLTVILAQEGRGPSTPIPTKAYIVGGVRHGISYFPRSNYPEIKPLVAGEMDFKHYHTYEEVIYFLNKWAKDYPNLVDLYSVGRSYEGRDIWQITITNKSTGKDTDKPAFFVEGNRHSGEVTAAECALMIAWQVLTNYGQDPEITKLVDTKTLYLRVKNNPDGSELYLNTAQSNRSTVRPNDDDGDGLLDEDAPEDLNSDGYITQMRKKVEEGKGDSIIDPEDKSGRLMKRVGLGKGNYMMSSEGWDNDGDGRVNEDGIGGLDLHRNYPENWRPMPGLDMTGRGWTQGGAGEYPLSEVETRYVVLFLFQHPNVSIGQTMDTTVPMLLRPPSTSRSEDSMFKEDLALYKYFDTEGKKITGYAQAGDVYWDYSGAARRLADALAGRPPAERGRGGFSLEEAPRGPEDPSDITGSPLFGHSPDWGYFQYGAIWYGDELWNGGRVKDYNNDGRVDEYEQLRWVDEEAGGKPFLPWTKAQHPTLGEVEIGGYNPKFFSGNPPASHLEEWVRKEMNFNLLLYKSLPQGKILSVDAKPVKKDKDTYEVAAVFTNEGFLPTAMEQAKRIKIVRPDTAVLTLGQGMELVGGKARVVLDSIKSKEKKELRWKVKVTGTGGDIEVSYSSTRGGIDKKKIKIGG